MTGHPYRFHAGQRVTVRSLEDSGHVRTPAYIRGKQGLVTSVVGAFPDPELLAYRKPAPPRPLYEVTFEHEVVWGPDAPGLPGDHVRLDLYEHWLVPAEEAA